ncbi:hypothetical protein FSP39_007549 [Pinctada imbricata]|uniref:C-type lectin domain-containing protein n=1 Tax=Pinctada imbricata TaxID=66713 RepID=A0AA88YGZ4_PINIB|nr:hypothetical protein FSP39_007549 [Pinctada imbricata]
MHDSRTMTYSNWHPDQGPNRHGFFFGDIQDCAMIRSDDHFRWHDGPCNAGPAFHYSFICQYDQNTWEFGDICIQVHYSTKDWDDARAYCRKLGGDLLEVRSSEMQLFVQNHLKATGKKPAGYWIGATDRHHEDRWEWLNGDKTMRFSNWEKGQGPGQSGFFFSDGSLEDCAMMRPDAGYKWHDGPCAGGFAFHYDFLCQFPSPATVVTPTPTTSSTTMPTDTSAPTSPVTSSVKSTTVTSAPVTTKASTALPTTTSTAKPTTTTDAVGVIIGG